jgi:protein O-mannosyl-transferase
LVQTDLMNISTAIQKYPGLILFCLAFLLYGNTLKNEYSLDDNVVTQSSNITSKGISSIPKILHSFYAESSEKNKFEYRPLVKISFALEHQFFGVKASVSHFINVILYALVLIVFLKWMKILFDKEDALFSFLIVFLFALMPIHTEVVASIKNRDVLLCALFCGTSSLHFFKMYKGVGNVWLHALIGGLTFYLAILSKLDLVPYIFIIPILALVGNKIKVKELALLLISFAMVFVLFRTTRHFGLGAQHSIRTFLYFENPLFFEQEFMYRVYSLFNCLGFYIIQCLIPFKQCSYYGYDTIPVKEFSFFYGTIGLAGGVFLLWLLWWSFRNKFFSFFAGTVIFGFSVAIYLNFLTPAVGIVADRYAFTPSLGIAILVVSAYRKFYNPKLKLDKNFKSVAILLIVIFGFIVIQRNTDWKDLETLTSKDADKFQHGVFLNYKAGANLVNFVKANERSISQQDKIGILTKARKHFENSLSTYMDFPECLNYASYALIFYFNDFKAAVPYIDRSLQLDSTVEILYYKGICYRELNKRDSSEILLLKCIDMDKKYRNAYDLLLYDYTAEKKYSKSISLLEKALENGIDDDKIRKDLEEAKRLNSPEIDQKPVKND